MKKVFGELIKVEKGQGALVMVLVMLVLGGLIIAPLLSYMGTGLKVGQMHEEKTQELYAADAGVEDAMWQIQNDQIPTDPYHYHLTVNNKDVTVEIDSISTEEYLAVLLDLPPGQLNANHPHQDWVVIYTSPAAGEYQIEVTYNGTAAKRKISGLGAWLEGAYNYTDNTAVGITEEAPNVKPYSGGTAFIWDWQKQGPEFSRGETKIQTFEFTPEEIPPRDLAWVLSSSSDVWLSTGGVFSAYTITAEATTSDTKWTRVVAHPVREGTEVPYDIGILAWEINPPT
ncbi:MAG: hypothetical protein U9R04_03915 [Chloroflexota bacterium]|nr:hypothetical protein [Chloroflexota bacterium]